MPPPNLLRLNMAYYAYTKIKVRASEVDSISFEFRSGVRKGCALSPQPSNYIIDLILVQALQDYPGVQFGANVHVFDLAYADDIASSYRGMHGLLEAVNRHATTVGMRINASKSKVMSALIPGEQRQAVVLDDEPLEAIALDSMVVTNGQDTEEIRSRIYLARSTFSRLQSCL